jgi:hypothetical protein
MMIDKRAAVNVDHQNIGPVEGSLHENANTSTSPVQPDFAAQMKDISGCIDHWLLLTQGSRAVLWAVMFR